MGIRMGHIVVHSMYLFTWKQPTLPQLLWPSTHQCINCGWLFWDEPKSLNLNQTKPWSGFFFFFFFFCPLAHLSFRFQENSPFFFPHLLFFFFFFIVAIDLSSYHFFFHHFFFIFYYCNNFFFFILFSLYFFSLFQTFSFFFITSLSLLFCFVFGLWNKNISKMKK